MTSWRMERFMIPIELTTWAACKSDSRSNLRWCRSYWLSYMELYRFIKLVERLSKRYGFVYVDQDETMTGTLQRIPKDSYYWYQKVIQSNGETL